MPLSVLTVLSPSEALHPSAPACDLAADLTLAGVAEDVAERLSRFARAEEAGRIDEAAVLALQIGAGSRLLGLDQMARVARDVAACTAAGDGPARAALAARLTRLGDQAVRAFWDLQEFTL